MAQDPYRAKKNGSLSKAKNSEPSFHPNEVVIQVSMPDDPLIAIMVPTPGHNVQGSFVLGLRPIEGF